MDLNIKKQQEFVKDQWGNSIEFLMSCIAMSVGLGNIWRFPFTVYENGGGAFLIPYLIVLTLIGRPLYYLEMFLGQFTSKANLKMYESLSPIFKGIGLGQLTGISFVATYYASLMAITLFYLVNSFTSNLPWTECRPSWISYLESIMKTCVPSSASAGAFSNNTMSSSEIYFKLEVLHQSDDISGGIGTPDWKLTICLFISWVATCGVSLKGVQSTGKASYFLALFPYVIMISLLIRAATLPGAAEGMYYFIKTDWNKLLDASVWYAAVTQCFFSLTVTFGSIIMYSSHNSFNHDIGRDTWIITILDTCTSLLSGITIFGILGNLAYVLGVTPDRVINSGGTGLAFISYPEAIAKFEAVPWLFAILFFLMIFVLGVGCLVALQGTVNAAIQEAFPQVKMWKISCSTGLCGFLVGLIYTTPGGQYMLEMIDHFAGTFVIFVFAILETVAVFWIYGLENLCIDVEFMTKQRVGIYWRLTWGIITPLMLIVIFIYFIITLQPLKYGIYDLYFPDGIVAVGWIILSAVVVQMTLRIFYYIYINIHVPKALFFTELFTSAFWRPSQSEVCEEWNKFKSEALQRSRMKNRSWIKHKLCLLIGR